MAGQMRGHKMIPKHQTKNKNVVEMEVKTDNTWFDAECVVIAPPNNALDYTVFQESKIEPHLSKGKLWLHQGPAIRSDDEEGNVYIQNCDL